MLGTMLEERWYVGVYYTRCDQKITIIFKFRELRMFDFCIFSVMLVHMSVYICWQCQPFWIVSLFLTDKKVNRVLVCSSIFYYSKKWIKGTVKNYIKCAKTFAFGESTISRTQVQLWYNRFKEGREDVNDDARQQPMKTLRQWRKWFWISVNFGQMRRFCFCYLRLQWHDASRILGIRSYCQ